MSKLRPLFSKIGVDPAAEPPRAWGPQNRCPPLSSRTRGQAAAKYKQQQRCESFYANVPVYEDPLPPLPKEIKTSFSYSFNLKLMF